MSDLQYSVYMLRCADGSLYTGIATDVARRVREHESSPRGAKYLRGRGPLILAFEAVIGDRASATRVESFLKRLRKAEKERLVAGGVSLADVTGAIDAAQASGSSGA